MPKDPPTTAKISASINDGEYSPESLTFRMDVNSFPTVSANIADTSGGDVSVKAPVSSEVIERIGALQEERLAGRVEPDFNVTADDGTGGSLTYAGYIAAPILEITKVSTTDKFSSVGRAALLDALDLSIYSAGYIAARPESGSGLKPIPEAQDGDVPGTIKAVTDVLVENFDASLAREHMEISKQLLTMQHAINNNGPLELWGEILEASEVEYESWDEAFKINNGIARTLTSQLKLLLTSKTPGFWNKVRALMANFQMVYVPSFDGAGEFKRSDVKVADPEGEIEASVTGLSVSDGSPRILQPGGVVMAGRATPTARGEAQPNPLIPRTIAFAPDPLLQGFIQREHVPFWLQRSDGSAVFGSEIDKGQTDSGQVNLSLSERRARKDKGIEYKQEVDLASNGVMTELCEVIFKEIQLAHSTAGLTLPLDFGMNTHVGKRVTIKLKAKDGGDGGEFTAFVNGITHTVDLRQGKNLNSHTQITLTHAKYTE